MGKLRILSKLLFSLIISIQLFISSRAQDFARQPLVVCWEISHGGSSRILRESDNEPAIINGALYFNSQSQTKNIAQIEPQSFYYYDEDSFVRSVNVRNGKDNWKTNIGGDILSEYTADSEFIYIQSIISNKNDTNPQDQSIRFKITALSKSTGIPKWQTETPLSEYSNSEIFLINRQESIYVILDKVKILEITKADGKIRKSIDYHIFIRNPASLSDALAASISILLSSKEQIVFISKSSNIADISATYFNRVDNFFIGDQSGKVIAYNSSEHQIIWKQQTGAKINSLLIPPSGRRELLVLSDDNFIYLLSRKNGKRLWKNRVSNRVFPHPLIVGDVGVFTSLNGNESSFVELNKGKLINRITLAETDYFTANPIYSNELLIFSTHQKITAYGKVGDCEKK